MNHVLSEKVVLGISACNTGAPVRYNRKGWDRVKELGREQGDFIWHPVCPEVMAGLGVPREAIKIVGGNGDDVWEGKARVVNRNGEDVTERLKKACNLSLDILKSANAIGYVYMDGSPSCGVYKTTLKGDRQGNPPGVFGSLLKKEGYFLIPALDLDSPLKWWDWRRRLHAYVWLKREEITSKQDLYNIWYTLKFLCQELDRKESDYIGQDLAAMPKAYNSLVGEGFRERISNILRQPSTLAKIKQRLWKSYVYYKRKFDEEIEFVKPPETQRGVNRVAFELISLERRTFEKGTFFSSAPILYRDKQRINKILQEKH